MAKQKKYHEKVNWKKELSLLPGYLIVSLWILFGVVVLAWIFAASVSGKGDIFSGKVFELPTGIHLENYAMAWKAGHVSIYFGNSLLYAVVASAGVLLIAAPGAYVISRFKFVGNALLKNGLIVAMSVPAVMIIMPLYSLSVQWDIKGRILLIILYILLNVPYTTVYLLKFFSTLSKTYEEAAAMDGCSPARTFWVIMLPLIQPALITVTIFNFLNVWNEFFMALIFASSESMTPVGVGLLRMVDSMKAIGQYGAIFAAVVIVFLPTFLLYIFMSEKIIVGITGGGVKG